MEIKGHRIRTNTVEDVVRGRVVYSPANSLWLTGMALAAVIGGALTRLCPAAEGLPSLSAPRQLLLARRLVAVALRLGARQSADTVPRAAHCQ